MPTAFIPQQIIPQQGGANLVQQYGLDPSRFKMNADGTVGTIKPAGWMDRPTDMKLPPQYFTSGMYQKDMQQYGQIMGPGMIFAPIGSGVIDPQFGFNADGSRSDSFGYGGYDPRTGEQIGAMPLDPTQFRAYQGLLTGDNSTTSFAGSTPSKLGADVMNALAGGGMWMPDGTDISGKNKPVQAIREGDGIMVTDPGSGMVDYYDANGNFLKQVLGAKDFGPLKGLAMVGASAVGMGALAAAGAAGGAAAAGAGTAGAAGGAVTGGELAAGAGLGSGAAGSAFGGIGAGAAGSGFGVGTLGELGIGGASTFGSAGIGGLAGADAALAAAGGAGAAGAGASTGSSIGSKITDGLIKSGISSGISAALGGGGGSSAGTDLTGDEAARQKKLQDAIDAINTQFGYGDTDAAKASKAARDSMYSDISGAVHDTAMRDLDKQFSTASNRNTFGLARSGLLGGSVDAESGGDLQTRYGEGQLKATQQGQQSASDLRSTDEKSRQNLISLAQAGLDTGTASSLAAGQMSSAAESAKGDATGATVGRLFDDMTQAYVTNQALKARYPTGLPTATGYSSSLFSPTKYSGRVQG